MNKGDAIKAIKRLKRMIKEDIKRNPNALRSLLGKKILKNMI